MSGLELFQTLWFFIVGLALFVFLVLDGFDLGTGMLLPFFTRNPANRMAAIGTIWPVWDGNELWGLLAGGALFAVFPAVFGQILAGLYPFVILLMVALMYRPVSFEVWFHSHDNRGFWEKSFALLSLVIALLAGCVLGATISGYTLDPQGMVTGGLLVILQPYNLLTGLAVAGICLLQGACWLVGKLEGEAQAEARTALSRIWIINLVLSVAWGLASVLMAPGGKRPLFLVLALCWVLIAGLMGFGIRAGKSGKPLTWRLFIISILNVGFFMAAIGALQFPILIHSPIAGVADVTIYNSSAPESTLTFLGIFSPLFLLLVAGYTIFVYRIFKGKVAAPSGQNKHGGISY